MNTVIRRKERLLPDAVVLHNLPIQLLFYFILIPYIYPKGFNGFFKIYKTFFTAWLMGAMIVMVGILCWIGYKKRLALKRTLYWIILYFASFLIITLIDQLGINDGFQKLFAAPVLCIFMMEAMKEYKYAFISVLGNILLAEFILGLTICSPLVMRRYFSEASHMLFMGHVQMASQLALIGCLCAYFIYRMHKEILRPALLFGSSCLIMIQSGTVVSLIALAVIFMGFVFCKVRWFRWLATRIKAQFWFYMALSMILIALTIAFYDVNYKVHGIPIDLHGRMYVWHAVLEIMQGHWLLGYGAYGAKFDTFWTLQAGASMNYAHSQLMQCLVDGGLVLTVLFYVMFYSVLNQMALTRKKDLYVPAVILFAFLMVMLIESMTEYLYIYIFLIFMAYLPEITSLYKKPKYKLHIEW